MIIRFNEKYYCNCVFFGIICTAISLTELAIQFQIIMNAANFCLITILGLQILRVSYIIRNKKWLFVWLLGLILMFYSYRVSNNREIFEMYVYVTSAVGVNFENIIRTMKKAWINATIGIVVLTFISVLLGLVSYTENGTKGYSLGFIHSNTLGFILFTICSLYFTEKYKVIRWKNIGVIFLMTVGTYIITYSRTGTFLMIVLMLVAFFKKVGADFFKDLLKIKFVRSALIVFIIVLLGFSVWGAINYSPNSGLGLLNVLMNERIRNSAFFYSNYSTSIFGQKLPEFALYSDDFTRLYLDNGYLVLLLRNGILSLCLYLFILMVALYKSMKRRVLEVSIVLLLVAISLFVEQTALRWCFNGMLFYAVAYVEDRGVNKF